MAEDHRLPEDTLWFIIEEDFRWYPAGEDPNKCDGLQTRAAETKSKRDSMSTSLPPRHVTFAPEPSLVEQMPVEPTASGKGKGKEHPGRVQTQYHQALSRGHSVADHIDEGFDQNVIDLVRTATFAHRMGMGQIVWTSWVPKGKKTRNKQGGGGKTTLSSGSTCIMMTRLGFAALKTAVQAGTIQRDHIDLSLVRWLRQEASQVGACYLFPASGSYTERASGSDPHNAGGAQRGRKSGFVTDNVAWGTRCSSDPGGRKKQLVQWQQEGENIWLSLPPDQELHAEKYRWQSWREPASAEDEGADDRHIGQEEEDTAGLTERGRRIKRTWERQDSVYRYWVRSEREAIRVVAGSVVYPLAVSVAAE
jgi:hypothetical protein